MLLNDDQFRDPPLDLEFERWCKDRLDIMPNPAIWKAVQKVKRNFNDGELIMIRRTPKGEKQHLIEILVIQ